MKNGIDWVIGSGELERKVVAITAAVAGPGRGRRGLDALRTTLTAVRATIVGGEPILNGSELESVVAALVWTLIETASLEVLRKTRLMSYIVRGPGGWCAAVVCGRSAPPGSQWRHDT